MKFEELLELIKSRKEEMPEGSYIADLFKEGGDRIIQKVGEEAIETVIAAKNDDKERKISEISDLFFHLLVLIVDQGISLEDIYKELEGRHNKE